MKSILFVLLFGISNLQSTPSKPIYLWIQEIVNDMIEMNDLPSYSHEEIPSNIKLNVIMVETVKEIKIENDVISMLVDHGTGKYCSLLKFKYIKQDQGYFLVFDAPKTKTIMGAEYQIINPWIEKTSLCN